MSKTVVGIFDSQDLAEQAARQVQDNGLRTSDISIIAKENDQQGNEEAGRFTNNRAGANDNVSGGAVTGGVLGGVAGLLLGMGTMVIPGLGVIAAAGPIAGLLSGAVTGGIVGGLVDLGIPEEAGRRYESEIKQGKILWSMSTEENNAEQVANILRTTGAANVEIH
ncbi:MAG: general stress protein [Firmicutes bacterium]|nr:general stress protein [Bacillota bacterium]